MYRDTTEEEATSFFADFYLGKHHFPGKMKPWGAGWCMDHYGEISTFDFDAMTRLVFLAHDKCFRVSVRQGGPRSIKICIWKREGREGQISERHPDIETALKAWRKYNPAPQEDAQ